MRSNLYDDAQTVMPQAAAEPRPPQNLALCHHVLAGSAAASLEAQRRVTGCTTRRSSTIPCSIFWRFYFFSEKGYTIYDLSHLDLNGGVNRVLVKYADEMAAPGIASNILAIVE